MVGNPGRAAKPAHVRMSAGNVCYLWALRMGEHDVKAGAREDLREFTQALLEDVRALERLLEEGRIESGVRRIGAEQELFLVDSAWRPTPVADAVLQDLDPAHFAPELARFNLEANLSPRELTGTALSDMETELADLVARAREAAAAHGARVVLTGILPTLERSDLTLENMVPSPRFHALNRIMTEARGRPFRTLIKGLDELELRHDNVMLEACNTSFQLHFQVGAEEFARLYNLAQVVTGPVLAVAANSPVFLQRRLWQETRIALFQQSLDVRTRTQLERGQRSRVTFGDRWVESSVMEIFREDVTRFRVLLATDLGEPSLETMGRGEVPALRALCLHNGTVYRWNRPCYGAPGGKPHLRIENRALPAGPTLADEMANAALFFGVMVGLDQECPDVRARIEFDHAKQNFINAGRYGLDAQMIWFGGERIDTRDLVVERLLPMARAGLAEKRMAEADVDRYLGIVEERLRANRNGARWALDSLAAMGSNGTDVARHRALTEAMHAGAEHGDPVHRWPLAASPQESDWKRDCETVAQVMTRDVFTVHPEDVIQLAASLMDWEHLRRVPVEDDDGRLVGVLTARGLLRLLAEGRKTDRPVAVREVMRTDPITCTPETKTLDAIESMRRHRVGCLLVVRDERLLGIVTEHDFIEVAGRLLEDHLRGES